MTAIKLGIGKVTKIHISTRNKPDTKLFKRRIVIVLLISTKNVDTDGCFAIKQKTFVWRCVPHTPICCFL